MDKGIYVKTFGEFSLKYNENVISDQDNHSKKLWIILEYIVAFHDRSIPQSTLVDLIWDEDSTSSNPENALKTCIHRVRLLLDELKCPADKLIISRQRTFSWTKNFPCTYDFELFLDLYNRASIDGLADDERIRLYSEAFELYKGEFLPKCSSEAWAANLSTRYHAIYVKMVNEFMKLLASKGLYDKIAEYCGKATALDSHDEELNYMLIYSLYKTGDQKRALEHYNRTISKYYDDFGINPPERFQTLFTDITTHSESFETDLNSIQHDLYERNADKSAYYCDYSIFQHMYKIQARACARNGVSIFLCLVTIRQRPALTYADNPIPPAMDKMQNILLHSLRSSDVFARYSKNQYIAMLPSACYENSLLVGERLLKNFDSSKPKINVDVSYSVRYLEPQMFGDGE